MSGVHESVSAEGENEAFMISFHFWVCDGLRY